MVTVMENDTPQILIVDDEEDICKLFKDFFDFLGYETNYETNGEKVLSELESMSYDVMFVDLKVDGTSGLEILKKSKSIHPHSEVIVVTGYGSDETVLNALHYGALSYIQKPISFSEIKIQTEMALAKKRFNNKTGMLYKLISSHDQSLIKHFHDIINLDRFSNFLNLTIDIDSLADSILSGMAEILPCKYTMFFFLDNINKEMVVFSRDSINHSTMVSIERDITNYYESLVNKEIDRSYNVRVSLSTIVTDDREDTIPILSDEFTPILIENSIHGVLGIANDDEAIPFEAKDILRMISVRVSNVLTNATLHRDTKLLALTDGLTGLLNHRAFHQRLINEFERSRRYDSHISLIVADFDDLKMINDTYGHPVGDEMLQKIGDILRDATRDSDVLARYGGDEFVILLPQTNIENACNMAERILSKVRKDTFIVQDNEIKCTLTIGVAAAPQEKIKLPEDLFETADHALYKAKRAGKNRISIAGQP